MKNQDMYDNSSRMYPIHSMKLQLFTYKQPSKIHSHTFFFFFCTAFDLFKNSNTKKLRIFYFVFNLLNLFNV